MKNAIIAIVAALTLAAGVVGAVLIKHNRLGDAYAQQALRFLIEGEKNPNNDYNRNLHELEIQISSPAERKSFDAICALKKADDDAEKAALAQADANQKNMDQEFDSVAKWTDGAKTVQDMRKGLDSDTTAMDRVKKMLDRQTVLLREANVVIDNYNAERQRFCYEPLKAKIEARSSDTPKACNKK